MINSNLVCMLMFMPMMERLNLQMTMNMMK